MVLTKKEIKARCFKKKYKNAKETTCTCGCGGKIKEFDHYGRPQKYINGHNTPRKYEDPTQYKREWNYRNRKYRYNMKTKHAYKNKALIINLLGGKCTGKKCKERYDGTNACIFQFHHKDPKKKKFNLTLNTFQSMGIDKIKKEAKKCKLFCANCHFKNHSGRY